MDRNIKRERETRPVFVDASGRRQRGLRVAGGFVVVPAVGYLIVLTSAVLVGPTILVPFLPLAVPPPAADVSAQPRVLPHGQTTTGRLRFSMVEMEPSNPFVKGAPFVSLVSSRTSLPEPTAITTPSSSVVPWRTVSLGKLRPAPVPRPITVTPPPPRTWTVKTAPAPKPTKVTPPPSPAEKPRPEPTEVTYSPSGPEKPRPEPASAEVTPPPSGAVEPRAEPAPEVTPPPSPAVEPRAEPAPEVTPPPSPAVEPRPGPGPTQVASPPSGKGQGKPASQAAPARRPIIFAP